MPVPSSLYELTQFEGSNSPSGSEPPSTIDNYFRMHAVFLAMLRDAAHVFAASIAGTNNSIVGTINTSPTSYTTGQVYRFIAAGTNTGSVTLSFNSIGAKAITKHGTTALSGGEIVAGQVVSVVYDGAQFQLLGAPRLTTGPATTASSGTAVDFTSIPSWAQEVRVALDAVSLTGTDSLLLQAGDSGGVQTTGYATTNGSIANGANPTVTERADGWALQSNASGGLFTGLVTLTRLGPTSNTWVASGNVARGNGNNNVFAVAGSKTLSGSLDRLRLVPSGSNSFDGAGIVSVSYQ